MTNTTIDLSKLLSNVETEVVIDEKITYEQEFLKNSGIVELKNVSVSGTIQKDSTEEIFLNLSVNGTMIILDSISLEPIDYPFSFEIRDNLSNFMENYENTLDICELLWENIVLEIPLKFTKVEDLSKFHGDGWKLVSEEEKQATDNPFSELLKNFDEE